INALACWNVIFTRVVGVPTPRAHTNGTTPTIESSNMGLVTAVFAWRLSAIAKSGTELAKFVSPGVEELRKATVALPATADMPATDPDQPARTVTVCAPKSVPIVPVQVI